MRRTGNTTVQLIAAPRNAVYVWPTWRSIRYPLDLARFLGRTDIEIVGLTWLDTMRHAGCNREIVVDHSCLLTLSQRQGLERQRAIRKAKA